MPLRDMTAEEVVRRLPEDLRFALGVVHDIGDRDQQNHSLSTLGPGNTVVLDAYKVVVRRVYDPPIRLTEFGRSVIALCFEQTPTHIIESQRQRREAAQQGK